MKLHVSAAQSAMRFSPCQHQICDLVYPAWATEIMEAELIIRNKTRVCKEAFQRCLKIQDLAEDDWLEQKSAEFNWWISGLNADKIGPGSLDSRLMLRPDVGEVVVDLLEGLIMALSKCEDIGG